MSGAVDDFKVNYDPRILCSTMQLMRLIDGHLRILVTVQQQERWIQRIDVKNRAAEMRKLGLVFDQTAEQQVESRFANVQSAWRGLRQDAGQV